MPKSDVPQSTQTGLSKSSIVSVEAIETTSVLEPAW